MYHAYLALVLILFDEVNPKETSHRIGLCLTESISMIDRTGLSGGEQFVHHVQYVTTHNENPGSFQVDHIYSG